MSSDTSGMGCGQHTFDLQGFWLQAGTGPESYGRVTALYTILLIWPRVALLPGRKVLSE